jgi:hypothetical protein
MSTDPNTQARLIEGQVGHPGEKWEALKERIQADGIRQFVHVQDDWLDLIWTLDAYRIQSVPPRNMGNPNTASGRRLGAIYRGKGHWFATTIALLLQNRTDQRVGARQNIQGFSQTHQIDVAWPARRVDPRICAETKVTGAPAYGDTPARAARADYASRRKELKFAATDLKLFRRQDETVIDHWNVWREQAPPHTFFLWAARLKGEREPLSKLVEEAQALINTYLDGAGIFAWKEKDDGSGYEAVPMPHAAQVTSLDDVLHRISAIIRQETGPGGQEPPAVRPPRRAVAQEQLPLDEPDDEVDEDAD